MTNPVNLPFTYFMQDIPLLFDSIIIKNNKIFSIITTFLFRHFIGDGNNKYNEKILILDFKLSPCSECCLLSSG